MSFRDDERAAAGAHYGFYNGVVSRRDYDRAMIRYLYGDGTERTNDMSKQQTESSSVRKPEGHIDTPITACWRQVATGDKLVINYGWRAEPGPKVPGPLPGAGPLHQTWDVVHTDWGMDGILLSRESEGERQGWYWPTEKQAAYEAARRNVAHLENMLEEARLLRDKTRAEMIAESRQ